LRARVYDMPEPAVHPSAVYFTGYGYSSEAQPLYSWGALAGFVGMQEHGFYAPMNASQN